MSEIRAYEDEGMTPTGGPVDRKSFDEMRKAVHNAEQFCINTNDVVKRVEDSVMGLRNVVSGFESRVRTYVAICVACTFFSVVSTVITVVVTTAQAQSVRSK